MSTEENGLPGLAVPAGIDLPTCDNLSAVGTAEKTYRRGNTVLHLIMEPIQSPQLIVLKDNLFLIARGVKVVPWTDSFAERLTYAEVRGVFFLEGEGNESHFLVRDGGLLADGRQYWDFTRLREDEDILEHYLVIRHGIDATCWLADEIDDENTVRLH